MSPVFIAEVNIADINELSAVTLRITKKLYFQLIFATELKLSAF